MTKTPITPETRYVSYVMVTDTQTFEIVKRTERTITIRRMTQTGTVLKREDDGGSSYPRIWDEVASDPSAPERVVRLRKDGTYRMDSSSAPLRPATMIDGKPVEYTDYRF